ncbi:MAG: hypothetical protein VYE27_05700 [Pseudomonadota bacterium]|nr:hypothetical protein [Pseudomonadota bacterium]
MSQLNPEIVDIHREHFLIKIGRFFAVILSVAILSIICVWTIKWYDRDINDLPVIASLQGEIRIKPSEIEGQEVKNQGLSVNTVLEASSESVLAEEIYLAPLPEDISKIPEGPAIEVENSEAYSREALKSSITAALESLLGIEKNDKAPVAKNIKLHLGSFPTADKANSHWFILKQLNSELLDGYEQEISKVSKDGTEFYRLGVIGFGSLVIAKDMCERLIDRGEQCIPAVLDN